MKNSDLIIALYSIILTFLFCKSIYSQVNQEWVERYNGPQNYTDAAVCLASDNSGNIYVTGYSTGIGTDFDYATIKYNSAGVLQWVSRYDGPGNSSDEPVSVVTDISGNVYVTGYSYGSGTELDYATIKYNSSGDSVWVRRYNGPGNAGDFASSIAVDVSGNVYVTGNSTGSITGRDYATIKYNSSGDLVWVERYSGPGNQYDRATSISVDDSGNLYVTGYSTGSGTYYDYVTIKYNPSGVQQWLARYNGIGNSSDEAESIVLDKSGNVYVTGSSFGSGPGDDYATIKYNSSGDSVWVRRYNGPGNSYDGARSLAVDDSGNVYVTGYCTVSGIGADYGTIKYNSSGVQQWVRYYNGTGNSDDGAHSVTADGYGNVYVTGYSDGNGTTEDYATIKYNSAGDSVWVARYTGPGNSNDGAFLITLDASQNVFVTGFSNGGLSGPDFLTVKYSQSTGISQISALITEQFCLFQNYPNPFNPNTIINYELRVTSYAKLVVYDIMGRELIALVNEKQSSGTYQVEFDGSGLPSGVYFYRLTAGEFTETKRMMLIK